MENEKHVVIDAIVLQQRGGFRSWIEEQNMWNILACGGLSSLPDVSLLETPDRPVDQGIKDGTNLIDHVLIPKQVLEPHIPIYLS